MTTPFSIENILTKSPAKPTTVEVTVIQTSASVANSLSAETIPVSQASVLPDCQTITTVIDLTGPERRPSLKRGRDGSSIGSSESSDCSSEGKCLNTHCDHNVLSILLYFVTCNLIQFHSNYFPLSSVSE